MDELELGYLLAVSGAAVWAPRPLVAMLETLGSARALATYAKNVASDPPPPCELLGAEVLARVAAVDDACARAALSRARADRVHFVTSAERGYPRRLRELCDPPPVLYYRGSLEALEGRVVAIVGSRAATPYGRSMATIIAADFASYGVAIVSGLARGIDAAAHRGAVRASAPTIAVLGSGIQALYPSYHCQLAAEIEAGGGAIVSEFPPEMCARAHQFPMRNRVVAALADATFVIEAGATSGALITARLAADLGRPVFALPGDVGRATSEGSNALIKDGVMLATGAADIAAALGFTMRRAKAKASDPCSSLLCVLNPAGSTIDEVCAATGLDPGTIAAQLTMLEMQGLVERRAGGLYGRSAAQARRTS